MLTEDEIARVAAQPDDVTVGKDGADSKLVDQYRGRLERWLAVHGGDTSPSLRLAQDVVLVGIWRLDPSILGPMGFAPRSEAEGSGCGTPRVALIGGAQSVHSTETRGSGEYEQK